MDSKPNLKAVDQLSEKAERYKKYISHKISGYYIRSASNIFVFNALQIIILVGAAVVPFLLNIADVPKLVPTIISAVVAVAAALANYYKFGERGRVDRQTAQGMQQEYNRYDTERGDYKDKDPKEALDLFMDRTEAILAQHDQRFPSPGLSNQNQK